MPVTEHHSFWEVFLGGSPTIESSNSAIGLHLGIEPTEFVDTHFVITDATSTGENIFYDIFFVGELNFKPGFLNRDGNYRFNSWYNSQDHTKWSDETKNKEIGFGFGLSFDQELTDLLGVFARYGWQDPRQRLNDLDDDFSLKHSWSAGMQVDGDLWRRDDDILAFAIGQNIPSNNYKDSEPSLNAETEGHFETYYNFNVNDHLILSPNLQVIWNPFGNDAENGDDNIYVGAFRVQIDF